jgi:uncharacterized protein (TIGR02246 family)
MMSGSGERATANRAILNRPGAIMLPSILRHPAVWAVVAIVLAVPPGSPQEGESGRAAPAIRAVWSTLDERWNAREATTFSQLFTSDASFQFPDRGEGFEGRAAILASFAKRFPTLGPDVRHRTTIREVQGITSGVAAVDGTVEILRMASAGASPPEVIRRFTIVGIMLRDGDTWRIRLLRALEQPAS